MIQNIQSKKEINFLIAAFIIIGMVGIVVKSFEFYNIKIISATTTDIYDHPLKVSNAALTIKLDIYKIHKDMKEMVHSVSNEEIMSLIEDVKEHELRVYKNFLIIEHHILGSDGLKLEKNTRELFDASKHIRREVISSVKNSNINDALSLMKSKGAKHILKLEAAAIKLNDYAKNKAIGFKNRSESSFEILKIINFSINILFFFLFSFMGYYIINRISKYISKNEHLTNVLSVIRDVNQLIVREKDTQTLIQESCHILTSTNIYSNAWIVTYDKNSEIEYIASTYTTENFMRLKGKLKQIWIPNCINKTINKNNSYSFVENTKNSCSECPLSSEYKDKSAFNIALKHKEKLYGYLTLSIAPNYINDKDELTLLDEVAGDIAYALYNLEMEQHLIEQEERYRYVIEGTTDGLWDLDVLSNKAYFSPRWKEILGYRDDELDNHFNTWEELIHPDDLEQTYFNIKAAQNSISGDYRNIHRLKHKDGHWVWIDARGQTIFDENKKAIRMVGSHTDITKERVSEAEQRHLYERLEEAQSLAKMGSFEYDLIEDNLTCSDEVFKIYGFRDFKMKLDKETFVRRQHPDDIKKAEEDFQNSLQTKGITIAHNRIIRYDNEEVRYVEHRWKTQYDNSGKAVKTIGTTQDVTEQKEIKNRLEISNDKFEKAINKTPNIIIISNLKTGEFYEINKTCEHILGYSREELIGKTTFDINLWVNFDDRTEYIETLKRDGSVENTIYSFNKKNGDVIIANVYANIVTINNEEYILAVADDITLERVTQERLLESEEKFRAIFEQAGGYSMILDPNTADGIPVIMDANEAACEIHGYSKEDFIGRPVSDVDDEDGKLQVLKRTAEIMTGKPFYVENLHVRKDGTSFPVAVNAKRVDITGKSPFIISTEYDISKLKQAQERVRKNEKILNLIIDKSPIGICTVDLLGNFVSTNPTYEKMLGYSKKELSLLSFFDITHPDYRPENRELFQKMFSLESTGFSMEKVYIRKDGKEIDVNVQATGVSDETGDIKFGTAFVEDVTEKKHARELLEQKKKELETIIQEAPNPIMIHNEEGKVLLVNRAWSKLTGYSYDDIDTIEKWTKKAYGEKMPVVKEYIDELYGLSSAVDEGEYPINTKCGNTIIWQFSSAPLGMMDNKRTVISSAMDITELKHKDEMLISQSRLAAMGEMIGMIAHQWRQPLTVISMNANNMILDIELDDLDAKNAREYLDDILTQTGHLSQTIDDFRNFFKPDKAASRVKLQNVLEETYSIVKDSIANNNIILEISYASDSEVDAYSRELMQVFVNIITNAKDSLSQNNSKNAQINIKVFEDEKYVITEICDNGEGIDEAVLPKIFDPYFTTKDEKTGTGLGLYMSKMIVEDHLHGKIEAINSESGACFRVKLLKGEYDEGTEQ